MLVVLVLDFTKPEADGDSLIAQRLPLEKLQFCSCQQNCELFFCPCKQKAEFRFTLQHNYLLERGRERKGVKEKTEIKAAGEKGNTKQ